MLLQSTGDADASPTKTFATLSVKALCIKIVGACLCNTFPQKSKWFFTENPFFMCFVRANSTETLSYLVNVFLTNVGNEFHMRVCEMDFLKKLIPPV